MQVISKCNFRLIRGLYPVVRSASYIGKTSRALVFDPLTNAFVWVAQEKLGIEQILRMRISPVINHVSLRVTCMAELAH